MSVGEDGGDTATLLGLRSMGLDTPLSVFNDGDGVPIRSGSIDPETGLPDPAADVDFTISLADGRSFEVDLAGQKPWAMFSRLCRLPQGPRPSYWPR